MTTSVRRRALRLRGRVHRLAVRAWPALPPTELGLEPRRSWRMVFGPYDARHRPPVAPLERGELTFDDARAEIRRLARRVGGPRARPVRDARRARRRRRTRSREFMVDAGARRPVRGAADRRGHQQHRRVRRRLARRCCPLDELFDDVVDSLAVGLAQAGRRDLPARLRATVGRPGRGRCSSTTTTATSPAPRPSG